MTFLLDEPPEQITTGNPNEILTVQQAAQLLKISYSHMLRVIRGEVHGMPPVNYVRAGRSLRIRRGALADWIKDVEHQGVEASLQRVQQ